MFVVGILLSLLGAILALVGLGIRTKAGQITPVPFVGGFLFFAGVMLAMWFKAPRVPPRCHLCGSPMRMKTRSTGNAGGVALALITFVIGVIIFLAIPILGWVVGPIICLCALFMGGKRYRVLRCSGCGVEHNRG